MSDKLTRCIRLLVALQKRGTVANRDVRTLLDCDEQTAMRDIRSLMDAGVPLERVGGGPETHYRIDRGWRRSGLQFSVGDALSLHFGRKLLSFLEGTMIPEWLDELREKLDVGADPRTLDREGRFARRLVYVSEPYRAYRAHDDTLDTLVGALLDDRELHVTYQSRTGERRFRLQPLALVIYRRALYLLARSPERDQDLRLPVERFTEARMGEPFVYPAGFDAEATTAETFGIFDDMAPAEEVRLRFVASVADLVRARRWHPSERFEVQPDGSLDLVMTTQGSELARLALEWGQAVEVIGPPALRERVRQELADALARYAD